MSLDIITIQGGFYLLLTKKTLTEPIILWVIEFYWLLVFRLHQKVKQEDVIQTKTRYKNKKHKHPWKDSELPHKIYKRLLYLKEKPAEKITPFNKGFMGNNNLTIIHKNKIIYDEKDLTRVKEIIDHQMNIVENHSGIKLNARVKTQRYIYFYLTNQK